MVTTQDRFPGKRWYLPPKGTYQNCQRAITVQFQEETETMKLSFLITFRVSNKNTIYYSLMTIRFVTAERSLNWRFEATTLTIEFHYQYKITKNKETSVKLTEAAVFFCSGINVLLILWIPPEVKIVVCRLTSDGL